MIYDDLPTNLDYLDESFGTAAGLREMRDDDLDDFDDDDDVDIPPVIPTQGVQQTGIISKVGGETIKMLRPEGIQTIENYFDNIPPDPNNGTNT
jgi:autophagy-related protein 2